MLFSKKIKKKNYVCYAKDMKLIESAKVVHDKMRETHPQQLVFVHNFTQCCHDWSPAYPFLI